MAMFFVAWTQQREGSIEGACSIASSHPFLQPYPAPKNVFALPSHVCHSGNDNQAKCPTC